MHLYVDISAHGLGHLAQTAPVIAALRALESNVRLTVASGLARAQLAQRIAEPFTQIAQASDFGFAMHNAIDIDFAASGERYRAAHADWAQRVAVSARLLRDAGVDLVLANAAYLPLAAAAAAGIPCAGLCSLNWADLFDHYFGQQAWATPIHAQMLTAYNAANVFLRVTPGMPMPSFTHARTIGPIATLAALSTCERQPLRQELAAQLGLPVDERWVLVAMGGMAFRLPVEDWPHLPGIHWLCPAEWQIQRANVCAFETATLPFTDLLSACDAVLTKPGYGTFVECACNGVPVLYVPREDWPEEAPIVAWMQQHARIASISRAHAAAGELASPLAGLWQQASPPLPAPTGAREAAEVLRGLSRPA